MRTNSGWSAERRAKHSEAIRRWAPWTKTTGPKTPSGKAICAANSHGVAKWTADVRAEIGAIKQLLRKATDL